MSVTVSYKNNTIATLAEQEDVKTLTTQGTWLEDNIIVGDQRPTALENDVNLYDYDGRLLYSYTKEEFAQLTELPGAPAHAGLVADGWNWDLEDAKAMVSTYGYLDIGMAYITDDEKTRFYLKIDNEYAKDISLTFYQSSANGIDIDWGDGSAIQPSGGSTGASVTVSHTYAEYGKYVVTFSYVSGNIILGSSAANTGLFGVINNDYTKSSTLYKVEIGNTHRVDNLFCYSNCFRSCVNLETITIPNKYTFGNYSNIFYSCASLKCIVYPKNLILGSGTALHYYNSANKRIILSKNASVRVSSYYGCFCIKRINPCDGIAIIGNGAFQTDYSLLKVSIPSTVTTIGISSFANMYSLKELYVYSTTPPTAQSNTFNNLPATCKIYVPRGTLAAYQSATNWSKYASQMYEMS